MDIKAAVPVVVAPPPLPQPAGVVAAPAAARSGRSTAPGTRSCDSRAGWPGAEALHRGAPGRTRERGRPGGAGRRDRDGETPAAEASAPAPAPAAPAEVSLDQEVFDQKLKELLDAGTDKRVAEGQARRAAMIAARRKGGRRGLASPSA